MSSLILKLVVRSVFTATTRVRAISQTNDFLERYLRLAEGLSTEAGRQLVQVPRMRGVDEDMRRWSFFMILEHNAIVSRCISAIVEQLVRGDPELSGAAAIDPKNGVMPAASAGEEQVVAFRESVNNHLGLLRTLGKLRGTKTAPHPIFGDFDAHKWNCMFSFHLRIHYAQAIFVARAARQS